MKHATPNQPFARTLLCVAMALASMTALAGVTDEDILGDAKSTDQVVTNGLGLQGQRYSTLDTLNSDNVKELRPVWTLSFGGESTREACIRPAS